MKKQLLIVGLWVCSGMLCQPIQAQSVDKANEEYKTFVRLNNENGDKGTLYSTLYSCYKEYVAVLSSLKPGNPSYDQAKSALRDIYPYLQQGAIYNSQKGSQQNALLLAQAYIDVPLMEAFRTETFPKDNYYPTMVYFAASGENRRTEKPERRVHLHGKSMYKYQELCISQNSARRSSEQLSFGFQSFIHGNQLLHRPQRQ